VGEKAEKKKKPIPSNIASGVAFGTKAMIESVVSAVTGIVMEPVRGAKRGGVKGGALGFGKGILGLVCKPVAGTIDFVTQTTRGIGNTPKTVYVGISSLIRKRRIKRKRFIKQYLYPPIRPYIPTAGEIMEESKKRQRDSDSESDSGSDEEISDDDIFLGEHEDNELFISRKALLASIKTTELGRCLINDDDFFEDEQERQKMKDISLRQMVIFNTRMQSLKQQNHDNSQVFLIDDVVEKLKQLEGMP
jgi:hypothetical protein